jgi:cytochrome c-type biogenesis protein CcsB
MLSIPKDFEQNISYSYTCINITLNLFLMNFVNLEQIENSLRNATFFMLFLTTFLYWFYTAFYGTVSQTGLNTWLSSDKTNFTYAEGNLLTNNVPTNSALNSSNERQIEAKTNKEIGTSRCLHTRRGKLEPFNGLSLMGNFKSITVPRIMMGVSNLLLVLLLLVRWEKAGHFPLSNLYESLMFLAWCCTFLYLLYCTSFTLLVEKMLGSLIAPSSLLMNAFATFSLPKEMQQASPLVPALQSNWLMMHVTVMIISYATLIIGSLLSILFLILFKQKQDKLQLAKSVNFINNLDSLSYRIIGLGFPFLTIGILSGAVWANEAWGSYWSWDPKETWALLTWLVFAIYLHTRLTKGWEGEKPAIIASIGFLVVWFCYLGVNLIGEGLHSYGFFN